MTGTSFAVSVSDPSNTFSHDRDLAPMSVMILCVMIAKSLSATGTSDLVIRVVFLRSTFNSISSVIMGAVDQKVLTGLRSASPVLGFNTNVVL